MRRALEYTIYNQELNETRAKLDEVNADAVYSQAALTLIQWNPPLTTVIRSKSLSEIPPQDCM